MQKADVLRHVPLFSELEAPERDLVMGASRSLRFPKNNIVFQEGEPGDYLLVMVKGRVRVMLFGDTGQETLINVLEAPALLGEVALLDQAPRSATVITVEPTEFLQITRAPFMALLKKHPGIAIKIMAGLARSLRKATEQIRTLSMFDVPGRLLRSLLMLAQERGETASPRMVIPPTPLGQGPVADVQLHSRGGEPRTQDPPRRGLRLRRRERIGRGAARDQEIPAADAAESGASQDR